jgi:diguanylate cyclase (GGDEF)-like protein
MLSKYLDTDSLCSHALQMLLDDYRAESGAIFVIKGGELQLIESKGISSQSDLVNNSVIQEVMVDEKEKFIHFPKDLKLEGVLTTYRPSQLIIKPIKYKLVMLGIVVLAKASEFEVAKLSILDILTNGLGLALHNAITYDQVQKLAALDSLTSFYNRRFGLMRLKEEVMRTIASNGYIGLIMFDIDHFKNINDTYGHSTGDKMLKQIANITRAVVRDGDVLIRYGGDEFLVVLVGASHSDTLEIAEHLRRAVSESQLNSQQQSIRTTLSIGAVSYPTFNCENELELIEAADQAMYSAKEGGRNQVISAT